MASLFIGPGVSPRSDLPQQHENSVERRMNEATRHADGREAKVRLAGMGKGPRRTWWYDGSASLEGSGISKPS